VSGIRALTIRQPWASLIAAGVKTIETRSWSTSYRGPLLIHAGKATEDMEDLMRPRWRGLARPDDEQAVVDATAAAGFSCMAELPLGAVVAVAELVDVLPMGCLSGDTFPPEYGPGGWLRAEGLIAGTPSFWATEQEQALGDFTPGRYAWLLGNVRPLPESIPAKGRQGLWRPDSSLIDSVSARFSEGGVG